MNVNCLNCKEPNNIEGIIWKIGHLTGMKTKTFNCKKCNSLNNYSVNVGEKNNLLKAILGESK